MKIVESTVNPKEHKLTENLSHCLKKIPAQVLLSGDHRTPVFIQNPPDEGLVPGVPGVGAGTRVWGPEVAVWSSTMALSCLKGPEEVCKSTDFRPSGGGPEGCHFCRERQRNRRTEFLPWVCSKLGTCSQVNPLPFWVSI